MVVGTVHVLSLLLQALVFRYRNTDAALTPSKEFDAFLWLSVLAIGFMAAWPPPFGGGVNLIFAAVLGVIAGGVLGWVLNRFIFRNGHFAVAKIRKKPR